MASERDQGRPSTGPRSDRDLATRVRSQVAAATVVALGVRWMGASHLLKAATVVAWEHRRHQAAAGWHQSIAPEDTRIAQGLMQRPLLRHQR